MICTPDSAADLCRGIQYTFGIYTIVLAIGGGIAQLVANRIDLLSRPGIEDVDYKLGEFGFASNQRKNQSAVNRRLYGLLSSAWFGLSIALVLSAVLSSLTINFPWLYRGGIAALFAPLVMASVSFIRYYGSQQPRLQWLKGIFGDELAVNIIFEHDALRAVDEILTLSRKRFRDLKNSIAKKRQERQDELDRRSEERARALAAQRSNGAAEPPADPPTA